MKFFKTFLASLLAVVVGMGLVAMLWTMVLVGMVASMGSIGGTQTMIANNSVLKLNLGQVTDSPSGSLLDEFDFGTMTTGKRTSLLEALRAVRSAATDDRIRGIYINFGENTSVSLSQLEEIRAELVKFRASGKFIVAYQEAYSQIAYWFASVADRVYTNPEGGVQWTGLSARVMFYKGLLDKLGIQPVVVRHGSFKSAVEPFILDRMSPENRLQYERMVGSMWDMVVEGVAASRGIDPSQLQLLADNLTIDTPAAALEYGFVDGLRYEDEVMDEMSEMIASGWVNGEEPMAVIAESSDLLPEESIQPLETQPLVETATTIPAKTGDLAQLADPAEIEADDSPVIEESEIENAAWSKPAEVKLVSFADYAAQAKPLSSPSRNRIAIVYAEGSIVSGEDGRGEMGSASIAKRIKKVREDDAVKVVVLRINSPGGSALASEVIWRELQLLKAQKPLIVSMGSYAASGGYYIAAPADAIYADRSTLTGSIGVFGLFANVGGALRSNLGITTDVVGTNRYSDIGTPFRAPEPAELAYVQRSIEKVYATFVGHVADGRNLTRDGVDAIGQGRVWTGSDALGIGLIDGHGGLLDAVALAADRVGVADDFAIVEQVDAPTGLRALFSGISTRIRHSVMRDELGEAFIHYDNLRQMLDCHDVQARMPYLPEVK